MLALVVTAMVGLGIASMLSMVGSAADSARRGRSVVMRAHLAQVRLRGYVEPALAVLQYDPARGAAIWLHDKNDNDRVNLNEFRVIRYDGDAQTLTIERVEFPSNWPPLLRQEENVLVPADSDFFTVMDNQPEAWTTTETMAETVADFSMTFNAADPIDADRARFRISLTEPGGGERVVFVTTGLAGHQVPQS